MNIEEGIILTLNNAEYIVVNIINYDNETYAYLISNFKPIDIIIAKITGIKENSILEEVTDQNVLNEILKIVSETE